MRNRIYVDVSVIGGCSDEEFADPSIQLSQRFVSGDSILVLSDLTLQELDPAPDHVTAHLAGIPEANIEMLSLGDEASELARAYLSAGVLPGRMHVDAQHIAIATVGRVDILVSWNFKHIVNLQRIHGYNAVNLREGYPLLEIRTPREVIPSDEAR